MPPSRPDSPPLPLTDREAFRAWVEAQRGWEAVDPIVETTDLRAQQILARRGPVACLPMHVIDRLLQRDEQLIALLAANENLGEEERTLLAARALGWLQEGRRLALAEQALRQLLEATDGRLMPPVPTRLVDLQARPEEPSGENPDQVRATERAAAVGARILLLATEGVTEKHLEAVYRTHGATVEIVLNLIGHPAAGEDLLARIARERTYRTAQMALLERDDALASEAVREALAASRHPDVLEGLLPYSTGRSGYRFRTVFYRLAETSPLRALYYVQRGGEGVSDHLDVDDLVDLLQHDRAAVREEALLATERLKRARDRRGGQPSGRSR